MTTYVIHHASCPDGMASAWAAWKDLGDGATYIPMGYTDPMPELEDGSTIYMVDFSLKRPVLLELAKRMRSITILDHHKSAEADLKDITVEAENVLVTFDMNRSGAQITWAFFADGKPEPKMISHIADRDLWKFELPHTREITEYVMSMPYDIEVYDNFMQEPKLYSRMIAQGEALLRQKKQQVDQLALQARAAVFATLTGLTVVPAANAPYFLGSDLAHELLVRFPNAPFAATYRDNKTGQREWSLRSMDDRMDVSSVATLHGGGGHRNAAGMVESFGEEKVHFTVPYEVVKDNGPKPAMSKVPEC